MRRIIILTAVVLFLAAPPAFGGPSPLAIAKRALSAAQHAQETADAGPQIQYVTGTATAARFGFAHISVACPQDYLATAIQESPGALEPVYARSYGRGALVSMWNPSNRTAHTGTAQITCTRGRESGVQPSGADIARELLTAERERLDLLR